MVDEIIQIQVFDDGNNKYKNYENKWIIIEKMFGGGKLKLKNEGNPNIIIPSISAWKTVKI